MTSVKLSQRSSRVSVGRYGGLRCQEATWGSVAHAEGLSRQPSGEEGRE